MVFATGPATPLGARRSRSIGEGASLAKPRIMSLAVLLVTLAAAATA